MSALENLISEAEVPEGWEARTGEWLELIAAARAERDELVAALRGLYLYGEGEGTATKNVWERASYVLNKHATAAPAASAGLG